MLQITPQQTLLLAITPVDFRKGIDGLVALCRQQLDHDPFCGTLFIFTNRRHCALKILVYDGQGFWLCIKRFSQGKLAWWPRHGQKTYAIEAKHLAIVLYQGNPHTANLPADWRTLQSRA